MIANRWKISYAGGDGNDVTLTDVGLVPPSVSLNVSSSTVQVGSPVDLTAKVTAFGQTPTGSVSFLNGSDVLGTAPLQAGAATIAVTLPRGSYTLKASYSGDSRTAPGTGSAGLNVTALVPTITSIDPATVPAGQKTTLTIHGTNFINGSVVLVNSVAATAPALVSSTEMRYDYPAPPYETDVQVDVWVSQPPPGVDDCQQQAQQRPAARGHRISPRSAGCARPPTTPA